MAWRQIWLRAFPLSTCVAMAVYHRWSMHVMHCVSLLFSQPWPREELEVGDSSKLTRDVTAEATGIYRLTLQRPPFFKHIAGRSSMFSGLSIYCLCEVIFLPLVLRYSSCHHGTIACTAPWSKFRHQIQQIQHQSSDSDICWHSAGQV